MIRGKIQRAWDMLRCIVIAVADLTHLGHVPVTECARAVVLADPTHRIGTSFFQGSSIVVAFYGILELLVGGYFLLSAYWSGFNPIQEDENAL